MFKGSRADDTPRLVKGRDKAEWQGRGRNIDTNPEIAVKFYEITHDTLVKGSCVRPTGFSSWGRKSLGLE